MTEEQVHELFMFAKAYYPYMIKVDANEIKAMLTIWNLELKNEKYDEILIALRKYVRNGNEFFPGIGQILELSNGSMKEKVSEALSKFKQAVKFSCSVSFDDPYIHKAVRLLGGWQSILNENMDKMTWVYKEFSEKYEDLIKRQVKCDDIDEILYTRRDIIQLENNLEILEPKIIGDKKRNEVWREKLQDFKQKAIL